MEILGLNFLSSCLRIIAFPEKLVGGAIWIFTGERIFVNGGCLE